MPADPQPEGDCFVFLCVPVWWTDCLRFPCLVQGGTQRRAVFMQVADADDVVEDVVHEDLFVGGVALSLYVPPAVLEGAPHDERVVRPVVGTKGL